LKVDRIIFWQPFASPHQGAFLEAVAEQFLGEVIRGVEQGLLVEPALGCSLNPKCGNLRS
jgi:hypothetical protein